MQTQKASYVKKKKQNEGFLYAKIRSNSKVSRSPVAGPARCSVNLTTQIVPETYYSLIKLNISIFKKKYVKCSKQY